MYYAAPMHFHGHAVNSLAYGEKRWFLLPPSRARFSRTLALHYAHGQLDRGGGERGEPMQCTQKTGDLLFVPTLW